MQRHTAGIMKSLLILFFLSAVFPSFAAEASYLSVRGYTNCFTLLIVAALALTIYMLNNVLKILKTTGQSAGEAKKEQIRIIIADTGEKIRVLSYVSGILLFLYLVYSLVQGSSYEAHVVEWMNVVVRWTHVVFGIAWIGASFYFNFLENSLNRTQGLRAELAGNLWAIHGGGFYYLEKYKLAPKEIPKQLHWFKYEAYFTWLSGFLLLIIVYYLDAKVYLIDPAVLAISSSDAIAVGVGSLLVGWLIYDTLCKSFLASKEVLFWTILLVFLAGAAWFFLNVFTARAAYIHVGALLGTLMAGNVFRVIIPAQKAMVQSAKKGELPNPILGKNALLRSRHNNYLTLPVIFIMISNHFPSTYGHHLNWFILIGLSLSSVLVKHFLNKLEKGEKAIWIMPIAVLGMISLVFVSVPEKKTICRQDNPATVRDVQDIIEKRCIQCHSSHPTDDVVQIAPNGISFDTPEDWVKLSDRILNRVVHTKTMPQGNKTHMTQDERDVIQCWIDQGAKTE